MVLIFNLKIFVERKVVKKGEAMGNILFVKLAKRLKVFVTGQRQAAVNESLNIKLEMIS